MGSFTSKKQGCALGDLSSSGQGVGAKWEGGVAGWPLGSLRLLGMGCREGVFTWRFRLPTDSLSANLVQLTRVPLFLEPGCPCGLETCVVHPSSILPLASSMSGLLSLASLGEGHGPRKWWE
jgi:hypothetical protein